jgi:hypothetical protein
MTRTVPRVVLPLTLLTATFALALPAQASLTRTFVSAAGMDSNPCTITQPCATFAHAYSVTAASGIVAALDPGKYGPLTITGPITINGNGWAAITAPAAGDGIDINAGGSDTIALIGLEIDGAGAGYNGVVLNSAGSLTVTNCVAQNFFWNGSTLSGLGILIQPSSGTVSIAVTNSIFSNNGYAGIYYYSPSGSTATAKGVIDHVLATSNRAAGIGLAGPATIAISNSVASNNGGGNTAGIYINNGSGALTVSIDNTIATSNGFGIWAIGTPKVTLGRSVITGNLTGVGNSTSPNTFYTYKDNRIDLNTNDITGSALNTTFVPQ